MADRRAPHSLLSIAYRELALNAEESHRYEEASRFRYRSMEVRRRERLHGLGFWRLDWWYWLASGYGERITQAAGVLMLLLAFFALCCTRMGFEGGVQLGRRAAVGYAVQVATFQKPEPKPATEAGKELMTAEVIIVPVQAALLLLAIRRKFTR